MRAKMGGKKKKKKASGDEGDKEWRMWNLPYK